MDPTVPEARLAGVLSLIDTLRSAERPVLLTHVQADGDALGSQLGLARALPGRATVILADSASDLEVALVRDDRLVVLDRDGEAATQAVLAEADRIVILDTSSPERLGGVAPLVERASAPVAVIDHHQPGADDAFPRVDRSWVDPDCAATALLVFRLLEEGLAELRPEIAEPLFVGIATDTGWFRHSNAGPGVFAAAASLVAAGADPERIHRALFRRSTLGRHRLLGEVLAGLQSHRAGALVFGSIRWSSFESHGVERAAIDGFIDVLQSIRGAEILALFIEAEPGRTKVSLRATGDADIHGLAVRYGGGGHARACGFSIEGSPDRVVPEVVAELEARLP